MRPDPEHPGERPLSRPGLQLLGTSFVTLFLELAMIRFVNSTVQVIAYFNNFLILSAFLGLGIGSLLTRGRGDWLRRFPWIFLTAIALMVALDGYSFSGLGNEQVVWALQRVNERTLPLTVVVLLVFGANLLFFVPLGFRLGQCLEAFENRLVAYSWDLLGSLLGVLGFTAVSFLGAPPAVWFGAAVCLLLGLLLQDRRLDLRRVSGLATAGALLGGVALSDLPHAGLWSPYYKVTLSPYALPRPGGASEHLGYSISVDKLRIQDALRFGPELLGTPLRGWWDYYRLPYMLRPPRRVLVLGGGSGNDAAVGLQSGAQHIDVVEIDPVIASLGFARHPHRPYADPRVRVVRDDARAFLRRAEGSYDLIVMNALDSHHQLPGLSTLRLESFIYTREAFTAARRQLAPDGLFVVHLSSSRPWMGERLFWSLEAAFGMEPRLFTTPESPFGSVAFVYGPEDVLQAAKTKAGLTEVDPAPFRAAGERTRLATDDWPHLYLRANRMPEVYVWVLASVGLLSLLAFRAVGPLQVDRHLELFLLGAGFMLLETRGLTSMAVAFGSTWIVSAVVLSAILLVIFLGNLAVLRQRAPGARTAYALLLGLLVAQYFLPLGLLAQGSLELRLVLVVVWVGAPVLLASFIFSHAFARVTAPAAAFGANLLGVVAGGTLEYTSMIFGLGALSLIAAALYGLAAAAHARAAAG